MLLLSLISELRRPGTAGALVARPRIRLKCTRQLLILKLQFVSLQIGHGVAGGLPVVR